jgi:uncharacterized protein involved in outer membrane biogenesis
MIGGALLVLIVAGVVILYLSLGSLIRSGVETYGPRVTKSKVRLGGVSVSPFSGKAQLSDLVVGNPEGFEAPSAFKLGALRMSLDVGSLRSDTVVIHEIIVTAPEITYELGPGGSNLKVLQKNVKEFTGAGKGGAGTPKAAEDGTKVVIDRLRVEKPKLHVSAAALRGETLTLALPDIELKDIGKEGQGASFAEVVDLIMKEVNRDTAKAVAGVDLKGLTEKARREAEKALEKEVEGAAPGMGEKLKGLFGK